MRISTHKDDFFNHTEKVGTISTDDSLVTKLSINSQKNIIYAAGTSGTQVFGVHGPKLVSQSAMHTDRPSTMVECLSTGMIVLQKPNSNALVQNDRDLNEVAKIDGLNENGKGMPKQPD